MGPSFEVITKLHIKITKLQNYVFRKSRVNDFLKGLNTLGHSYKAKYASTDTLSPMLVSQNIDSF